jgi:hypothetical protein
MPLAPKGSKASMNKKMSKDKTYNPAKSNVAKAAKKNLSTVKGYSKAGGGMSSTAAKALGEKGLEKGMQKAETRMKQSAMAKKKK